MQDATVQFSLKTIYQNLISKQQFFYLTHKIHNGLRLGLFHGLSLKKSLIKNYNTFILGQVIIRMKHN